jgi:hypothetical protein
MSFPRAGECRSGNRVFRKVEPNSPYIAERNSRDSVECARGFTPLVFAPCDGNCPWGSGSEPPSTSSHPNVRSEFSGNQLVFTDVVR